MKTSVSVVVTKSFEWKGQSYTPGQAIQLTPIDAVVLAKKHQVSLTRRKVMLPSTPPPVAAPDPEPVTRTSRGRYRRRDLQAENGWVRAANVPTEVPSVPPFPPAMLAEPDSE